MEAKVDEAIKEKVVTSSLVKSINRRKVAKFVNFCFLLILAFLILIGVSLIAIFAYFEYSDNICMKNCLNEWKYTKEVCQTRYCY